MRNFAGGLWVAMGIILLMAGCAPKLNTDCQSTEECQAEQVCSAGRCVSAGQTDGDVVPTEDGTTSRTDARPDSNTTPDGETDGDRIADAQLLDAARDGTIPTDGPPPTPDLGAGGEDGAVPPPTDALPPDATHADQGIPLDALPDAAQPTPDAIIIDPDAGNCESGCLCNPTSELCNGIDDDCDDAIDEEFLGLGQPCFAGRGICQAEGVNVCGPDSLSVVCDAEPGLPGEEICDGLDNDCDGDIDEDLGGISEECGLGACVHSVTACDGGDLAICNPFEGEMAELCNGLDDDCDGAVDDGVLNACGTCGPIPIEICDGADNNCDGQTDEGGVCSPVDAGLPPDAAPPPTDAATDAMLDAAADAAIDAEPICLPSAEICDELDNDCDGAIDNDVLNACGACGPVPVETCNDLDDDCNGVVDNDSNVVCHCPDRPNMPYMQLCQGGVLQPCPCPSAEICDGVDNDLNASIDDVPGISQPCSQGVGACRVDGSQQCDLNLRALTCSAQELPPSDEVCNGIDDDCDNIVDNAPIDVGAACESGIGACQSQGQTVCQDGNTVCDAVPRAPVVERCNAIDDDCDGIVDNSLNCPTWTAPVVGPEGTQFVGTVTEVTKAQYASCVAAGACVAPDPTPQGIECNWQLPDRLDHPINCLTWTQARTYCQWVGGDLPTEEQWETLAGGRDLVQPWGNLPGNCNRAHTGGCLPRGTVPVLTMGLEGVSPSGAHETIGGLREWTRTLVNGDPVLKGGGFDDSLQGMNINILWNLVLPSGILNNRASYDLGSRCFADIQAPPNP